MTTATKGYEGAKYKSFDTREEAEKAFASSPYDYIKRNWREFAEYGTAFENFDGKASHSHAWSAHPSFLLPQILLGIKQTAAGWRDFTVNPNYFVDEAEIVWPTPRGNITVSWKKNPDGTYTTTRTLP